ncbi:tight adherence protein B [Novimethylophilus kurashikiensis]|uniref:Tight adherence protein B n=1 Tax=Novimethylophilus kurashikiensis TaxID=1825523 RepID=A0A2R5F6G0_9PROT|nr:type II secretion system F family protein [Novimethylophilus kurashikiensis]GBG13158.1 tight adherence protein B [Novimethylophilus kurashikiensis]
MDYAFYLFIVLGFLAVVLFLEGAYLTWNAYQGPEAKRIEKRLRAMSAGASGDAGSKLIKQRLLADTPVLEKLLLSVPRIHHLDRMLLQSGLELSVARFLGLTLFALAGGMAVAVLLHLPLFLGIVAAVLPWLYVLRATQKRKTAIEEQLPEALDLMARAMLAGHAFPSALKMVGDEMPEPVSGEFRIVFDEINYGISVADALNNLAARVPSTDVSYFVISVLIQRETGGNLAELLGNLSKLIRERLKLMGTVRVLSAEGRLSAKILTVLPFAVAVVVNVINPKFMRVLWQDPIGLKMITIALVMVLFGVFWMWRVIKIRV